MCSHFHKVVYSYVDSTWVFDHALIAWSTLTCPAPLRGRWTPEKDGRLAQDGTRYAPVNGHRHPLILSGERHCENWYLLYYGRDENQTNTAVQNLGWVHLVSTYEGGHLKRGANHQTYSWITDKMVQTVQKIMNDILPFLNDSKYLFLRLHGIQKFLWSKVLEELVVLKLFSMLSASILLPLLFSGHLVETSTNRSTQVALQHLYPGEHSQKR